MITALAFLKDLAIGYASYRKSLRLSLTCSGISPVYMWLCSKGTQQWTLSVCYVHSPPPPRFVLCCCCYHHHHHHHQTNFIHIHGRSLYIRSLAFECCNIALVYIQIHVFIHTCPKVCMCIIYTYILVDMCINTCTCMYIIIHIYILVDMCTYIYIHTICTHVHKYVCHRCFRTALRIIKLFMINYGTSKALPSNWWSRLPGAYWLNYNNIIANRLSVFSVLLAPDRGVPWSSCALLFNSK